MLLAAYPTEYDSVPLFYPKAAYDSIGSYVKGVAYATPDYNCLGYAVGFPGFLWPWRSAINGFAIPATMDEVELYLKDSYGYSKFTGAYQPQIMAYGETYLKIGHFAKAVGNDSKAKWGQWKLCIVLDGILITIPLLDMVKYKDILRNKKCGEI